MTKGKPLQKPKPSLEETGREVADVPVRDWDESWMAPHHDGPEVSQLPIQRNSLESVQKCRQSVRQVRTKERLSIYCEIVRGGPPQMVNI